MKLALAGDTMLGRGVAQRLADDPHHELFAPELVDVVREADLVLLNLPCRRAVSSPLCGLGRFLAGTGSVA